MKKVYNLTLNGDKNLINASGDLYFSWSLSDCKKQLSYTLTISDGEKEIYSHSEKCSSQNYIVSGLKLAPLKEYYYWVSVKTDAYEEVSDKFSFVSAIDNFGNARWISNGTHFVDESKKHGTPAEYFKKTFSLEKLPQKAIVNVCGLGLYELFINGKRVGDRVLEPAFTDYNKRVLYSTYDVSDMLAVGENEIEVILGDGWYNQTTKDTWGFYRAPWRDCPKMIFRLDCDGEEKVVSNTSWQVSYGELISNSLRVGEFYDYTKKREYYPAVLTTPAGGILTPSYLPPIRECEELTPVSVYDGDGCKIYDFGKNIAGYCSVKLASSGNDIAYFEYSDRMTDGRLDNESNSMYIFNSTTYQKDGCRLVSGINEYKPKFVYHGFRYLAVFAKAEILDVKAYFVRTDLQKLGAFNCSSDSLNKLYDMSMNAILSNYHGMPTDCPHREKNGWTGDAQLSLEPSIYNFDMLFAYKKWLDDFIDCQLPSGQISAIIPTCGWGYNWGSGPAWDIAFFRIPQALKRYYGDTQTAKNLYPYLEKYFNYISNYLVDGLMAVGLGDWNYPKSIQFDTCPLELSTSCYYMLMADIMAEFSFLLSNGEDNKYRTISAKTKENILNKYREEKSLTGLAALDYFGICETGDKICNYLEKCDCAVHFGILGAKFIFETLGKYKRADLGFKILSRTEYPSFGYWEVNGQTSLCEDFELTNSLNHHMYSPISEYMVKHICGVEIISQNVFSLNPNLPEGVENACYSYKTKNGELKVCVKKINDGYNVAFSVPANCVLKYNGKEYAFGEYEI